MDTTKGNTKAGTGGGAATGSKMAPGEKQGGEAQTTKNQAPPNQSSGSQASGSQGGEQNLLQQAKQVTSEVVNQVQEQAGSQLNRGKETAAGELTAVVNAVRQFGESLSGEANGPISRYAADLGDKAAQKLERFSNYIREQDPKRLLADVQNFGRRQPALLLGGAFLLGLAGARLIKSSMEAVSQNAGNTGSPTSTGVKSQPRYNPGTPAVKTKVSATQPSPTPNAV